MFGRQLGMQVIGSLLDGWCRGAQVVVFSTITASVIESLKVEQNAKKKKRVTTDKVLYRTLDEAWVNLSLQWSRHNI